MIPGNNGSPETGMAGPKALAAALSEMGYVDDRWHEVWAQVPRGVFVPEFWQRGPDGSWTRTESDAGRGWLATVYSDEALVTKVGDQSGLTVPVSSSSRPSLMSRMLAALALNDGMRVLEVGTGTGFNTALLCERLGPDLVTTIDIDAGLASAAGERLASLNYRPTLLVGDAIAEPPTSQFDRIIATCGLYSIPHQWLELLGPGGRIVAPLLGGLGASAIAVVTRVTESTGIGQFAENLPAPFMPGEPDAYPSAWLTLSELLPESGHVSEPRLHDALSLAAGRFTVQWAVPELRRVGTVVDGTEWTYVVDMTDQSWLAVGPARDDPVRFGGTPLLLERIRRAVLAWDANGRPGPSRHRLHTDHTGTQVFRSSDGNS